MHKFFIAIMVCTLALASAALEPAGLGGVVGVFQGRIVHPSSMKAEEGILYVRARNGMARKVRVEKAVIEYDEDVPKSQRAKAAASSLCADTLVRVTAEQSEQEDGAWKALNILILADPDAKAGATLKQASFEQAPKKNPSTKGKVEGFCVP